MHSYNLVYDYIPVYNWLEMYTRGICR